MSELESEYEGEHKRKQMSGRQRAVHTFKFVKLKLRSRDTKFLVVFLLGFLVVLSILISTVKNVNLGHGKVAERKNDQNDLATKDLLGLEKSFHQLLNKKIIHHMSKLREYEGFGFGNAAMKKMHHKQGTPPITNNPGILNELDPVTDSDFISGTNSISQIWRGKPTRKLYMILGKNQETGIKNRKRREHWLMEKFSILNKQHYAEKHGYELIVTSSTPLTKEGKVPNMNVFQKRYQHETREGWEKFDLIRKIMRESTVNLDPEDPMEVEEWYWYLDMNTLIMEPDIAIDKLVLDHLDSVYRDMEYFDPNNLYSDHNGKEKLDLFDDDDNTVDLILTQDCKGINLNSFLIKKSHWSNLLLDILWEPVFYKQMHLKWLSDTSGSSKYGFTLNSQEHTDYGYNNDREEKNCLEFLINTQSWIRSKIGFFPVRVFNSLSKDFCNDDDDDGISSVEDLINIDNSQQHLKQTVDSITHSYLSNKQNFHYNETDRDFLVNFMMCERHGSCWDRFQQFSKLNEKLHRGWW